MASNEAIAVMREKALARLSAALGDQLSTEGLDRDPGLAEAQLLERIADVLEADGRGLKAEEPESAFAPDGATADKPKQKGRRA